MEQFSPSVKTCGFATSLVRGRHGSALPLIKSLSQVIFPLEEFLGGLRGTFCKKSPLSLILI